MVDKKEIITTWFREYSDDVYNFLIYYTGRGDIDDLGHVNVIFNVIYDSAGEKWIVDRVNTEDITGDKLNEKVSLLAILFYWKLGKFYFFSYEKWLCYETYGKIVT